MTSPVTPQRPLLLDGLETPTLGGPGSLDSLLAYNISLLENATDLAPPLVPLPGDLQLLADTALEQRLELTPLSPRPGPSSSIVPPMPDLSWDGPFDPYCAPADTGVPPLTPPDMPCCRYRMTSYESAEVADVDPAYGLQHHPCFLEFVGWPGGSRTIAIIGLQQLP